MTDDSARESASLGSAPLEGPDLVFHAATEERWEDVEQVLGRRGGHDGCWCMRWRVQRSAFEKHRGEGNRRALRAGLAGGRITGVLGYRADRPVSWCAVGPREQFPVLDTTDLLARVDDVPVWSLGCCHLARRCRGQGLAVAVLTGAADFARDQGARVLEAYPLAPALERVPVAAAWTGFESTYLRAGFIEVARRAPLRPIMRLDLAPEKRAAERWGDA
jgi:GNAT superfamily N-acetyltransferase